MTTTTSTEQPRLYEVVLYCYLENAIYRDVTFYRATTVDEIEREVRFALSTLDGVPRDLEITWSFDIQNATRNSLSICTADGVCFWVRAQEITSLDDLWVINLAESL